MLLGAHLALLSSWDLAAHPVLTLALLATGFAALVAAVRRARRRTPGAAAILLVAIAARLLLLPLPPTLSDDLLRYLWDGRVVAAGANPYLSAPDASELEPLRDELWRRLPHRQVATVYPPLAMAAFSIAAALPAPQLAWKGLATAADLATCWLLLGLARRLRVPRHRVLWYAWNPLVTLEVAGMGHVDSLGVAGAVAAVALLARRPPRALAATAAAAAGVLVKLVPLVALPLWARRSRRPVAFLALAGVLVAGALAPVAISVGGVPPGLVEYGVSWEFNGPLYEPLWRTLEVLRAPAAVKVGLDALKLWTGEHDLWNRFYPFVYGRLMAKGLLAVGLLAVVVASWRRRSGPVAATGALFGAVVLASATVYPWYLLWVLPWAALAAQPAWLLLSGTILLSYLPQLTPLEPFPWGWAVVWLPFFLALGRWWRWSTD